MKVATTYQDGQVFQHFGKSEQFKLYDVKNGEVVASAVLDTEGEGHGALADLLKAKAVDVLICGGIGAGAQNALAKAGIRLYAGVSGSTDDAVSDFLAGKLVFAPGATCSHHGEGAVEGGCGGHHGESCAH